MEQLVIAIVFMLSVLSLRAIVVVGPGKVGFVERLGVYRRTVLSGLSIVVPFADRVIRFDVRPQILEVHAENLITRDNHTIGCDVVIHVSVVDPVKARYEVADFRAAVEQLTVMALEKSILSMDREMALSRRDEIDRALRHALNADTPRWGVRVDHIKLGKLVPLPTH